MSIKILIMLYSIVGIIEMIAYMPQIYRLVTNKQKGKEISILAFSLWTMTSFISASYAYFHVKDMLIFAVSSVHIAGCGLILALTVYNRHFRKRMSDNTISATKSYNKRPKLEGIIVLPHESSDVAILPSFMQKVDDYAFGETPH